MLSVTFVCFVFWRNENSISISYIRKQTTTPSVFTIGLSRFRFPHRLFYSPLQNKKPTLIHLHTCTLIHTQPLRDFLDFFIVLFHQCFIFALFFGLKLTNIGPRSTTRDKHNGKNNIKTTTKTHFQKGDNVKNNKTKVEIEGSTSNNRICTQQTLKKHTNTHVKTTTESK